MTHRLSAAGAALAFALGGTALAQTAWVEISDDVTVTEFNLSADALEDMDVLGADGNKIGEVDEVLGTEAGTATAFSIDFDDDAGFGEGDDRVVPFDRFTLSDNKLTLDADAAAIGGMDVYDDGD